MVEPKPIMPKMKPMMNRVSKLGQLVNHIAQDDSPSSDDPSTNIPLKDFMIENDLKILHKDSHSNEKTNMSGILNVNNNIEKIKLMGLKHRPKYMPAPWKGEL